ncbi:DUF2971 domain-containing protein [Ralstonia pseudosolanacearum]|uniref:DUF2971 domain-containing protein n=1 Tax=Ralstonia pseudosolanacearum TaxID=1310165 RepID=UPI001FFA6444|nr:DUF2971 domain-containing protein [Ralstonia pseudosolanacearum]
MEFEVLGEAIFLAGANALNDPDEGMVRWRVQGSFEDAFKFALHVLRAENGNASPDALIANAGEIARNMVASPSIPKEIVDRMHMILGNLVRIACFTTHPLNGPMWTHYGNFSDASGGITPHGGLCIEYTVDDAWRQIGLRPVQYVDKRPQINMLARDSLEAQFAYATSVKSPDWAYEDEWRLVSYIDAKPPWPDNLAHNSKLRLQGAVRSVILGLNVTSLVAGKVIEVVRRRAPHVVVKQVVRNERTAALTLVSL